MKTNFLKTLFNDQILHVAYDEDNLIFIRATDIDGKEVVLNEYDKQIMNDLIIDYISDLN